jgi:UDP-N-acetylmuramate dehydrogenase
MTPRTLASVADDLVSRLPGLVERDVPIATLTTYRLGGPVAVLVRARRLADLVELAAVVVAHAPPVLVVGRGSNLLVADRGFPGVAVVLEGEFDHVDLAPAGHPDDAVGPNLVRAGGAVALPVLARRAAAAGLGGLEFYVGIPGSVGGAVRMNAGGHGRDTAEVLRSALVVDLGAGGTARALTVADLRLGYRRSALGPLDVVTGAELHVAPRAAARSEAEIAEIVAWRREHQPGGANAGSVFSNPEGDSAGRLIDATGLKGLRIGGAVVSDKHANFFQAEAGATAGDVHGLVHEVQRRVEEATGVRLVPELRMVGFEDPS